MVLAAILLTKIHSYPQAHMIEKTRVIHDLAWRSEIILIELPQVEHKQILISKLSKSSNPVPLNWQNSWSNLENGRFFDYYKTLDDAGKQNLEIVVQGVISEVFMNEDNHNVSLNSQEYFPGYGYAKPGYTPYRKGEEVEREFLYAYWKDEEIDELTSMEKELTIEVKLLAQLKLAIPELVEGVKAEVNVDGTIHQVVKIKIKKELKIHTKQKLKLGVESLV